MSLKNVIVPTASISRIQTGTPMISPSSKGSTMDVTPNVVEIIPKINRQPVLKVGNLAPDFTLKSLEGDDIKLSDMRGKAVLINVWASWCPPCREEMQAIQAAYKKYQAKGLVVLAIDFTIQDDLTYVKSFVQELKLSFPILLDETGDVSTGLYGVIGLPTSFFIDTQGVLQRIQVGAMLPEKLEEYLLEILPNGK